MMSYSTEFVWDPDGRAMRTFYNVSDGLGYVPAGIQFSHRAVDYSTARLIGLLPRAVGNNRMPQLALKQSDWPHARDQKTVDELRARFRSLSRALERAAAAAPA